MHVYHSRYTIFKDHIDFLNFGNRSRVFFLLSSHISQICLPFVHY
jgi:hypothetical protein